MYAVIYIPDFFLHSVLRAAPGLEKQPVILIDEHEKKQIVLQLTAAARSFGINEGMTSTQALARCPALGGQIRNRSPSQEKAATEALLQCAYSFSPAIESTADGVCTLDLAGLGLNSGGASSVEPETSQYEELGHEMLQRLAWLHLPARVGIAENPWLALLAARASRDLRPPEGRAPRELHSPEGRAPSSPCCVVTNSTDFLHALPVESIGPSFETLSILKKWGIHTLGQFVALGKEPLSTRLGPEALALHERATANSTRPLKLVRPPDSFHESIEFEHEIETIEPLLFVLRRFLEQLLVRLEMMYWVAQELRLRLRFESGEPYDKTFRIPAPTSNVETLFRMLYTHLETLRTEHAIVALELSAKPGRAINHQFGLFESVLRDPNHFHETLARLTALVGSDRVGTPVLEESHRPDAFRMERVSLEKLPEVQPQDHPLPRGPALHWFRPPIAATVTIADRCPTSLESSVFQGILRDARGPWRSSGQWWDNERWNRDEWDVQASNGRLYRISRQSDRWFVEGVYD